MWREPLETFPDEAWDAVIDLNLKSPFWLVQALLPALRRAGTADDPARIINIGSIAAIHVAESPNYSYASSKAALHQLTRVLARELGPQHITVNAVAPGPFPSQMMAPTLDAIGDAIAAKAPLRRLGRDDDMAGIAVFLASRAATYLTGTIIPIDGGIATTASGT
jgi:NAD(P)-dependent dehydrogenase (short-subunit alcohol dehydrogenase family)